MNQIENRMIQRNSSIHVWLCLTKTKSDNHIFFFMLDSCALCWLAEAAQSMQICLPISLQFGFSPGPACCWHPLRPFPSKHNQPAHWKLGVVSTWWLFQIQKGKKKGKKGSMLLYKQNTTNQKRMFGWILVCSMFGPNASLANAILSKFSLGIVESLR